CGDRSDVRLDEQQVDRVLADEACKIACWVDGCERDDPGGRPSVVELCSNRLERAMRVRQLHRFARGSLPGSGQPNEYHVMVAADPSERSRDRCDRSHLRWIARSDEYRTLPWRCSLPDD